VSQIQQAGWHLLEMINDVLDLSRIESGNLRLSIEALDLHALLAATVTMVEADAKRRGIQITQDLGADATVLRGDATRVKQILINLLSNAVKYNADHGRIHIASRMSGDAVEVIVTDTGLGMTPEQMGELFQPFNRLGRERSQQEGTGIGLVISQRLAELMGGTLRARSVPGEGSSFILALPAVSEPHSIRSDYTGLQTSTAEYHRRVVHYVEDNETNVEVMRGILAQRPQVIMDVSVTGLDGLAAIRSRRPDVILLDMHLPDISGMELLRHLKSDPATVNIPVVVVSADALASQIDAAREAGADRYVTKPVSVSEFLEVLDEVLGEAETRFG
jgi:CheY-like chemotaxis protein/two-component sensor histidine kinase